MEHEQWNLEAQERELLQKLEEIRALKQKARAEELAYAEDERRTREREKPIVVNVRRIHSGTLVIASEYREDVIREYKATKGRTYRTGENMIPLGEWDGLVERLEALPNVEITWAPGMKDHFEWYLNAPPFEVDLYQEKELSIKPGPQAPGEITTKLRKLEGLSWNWEAKTFYAPLTEGHKVFEALADADAVYSDEAAERITAIVERRLAVDKLALADDVPGFDVNFPPGEDLHPFQRVGVAFTEAAGGRALIADEMGLGKTWQAIGFSQRLAMNGDGKTLVICKAGLRDKWAREIKNLTGEEPYVCKGLSPRTFDITKIMVETPRFTMISYTTLGSCQEVEQDTETGELDKEGNPIMETVEVFPWTVILKRAGFDLIIVDESHYVKNPDSNRTRAFMKIKGASPNLLHLTGTPVLNRPGELWPILHTIDPNLFPKLGTFLRQYATGDGKRARNVEQLKEVVKPFMIRRTKRDVMKDLPFINRITEIHSLSDDAQKRYEEVLRGIWEEMKEYNPRGESGGFREVQSILAQITRLKQICAIDKASHTADLATEIIDQQDEDSTKKVLIFTHFKAVAANIAQRLGHQAVCTVKRTPNDFVSLGASERDQLFEEVRNRDDIKFVITTEAAKEGHNLDYCWWTIFNDLFWTPASHEQCEGRAYGRMNNPHEIDSYYMVSTDPAYPIEEWLMEILKRKMRVFEEVVEGVEQARDTDESVVMELINRMRAEMWRRG